jgi:hypothetical protein
VKVGRVPAFLLLVLLAGCAPRKTVRLVGGRAETLALLEQARKAREGLVTLAASGEVSLSQKGKGQSGNFQMWFERPDRMRIDLSFLFFRLASAVVSGDSGEVYFPTKRQSYYGKVDNDELRQNLGGVSLAELTEVLQGRLPLPGDSVLGWEEKDGKVLFQYRGNKTALLDLERLVVLRYEERDSSDRLLVRGKAEEFQRIQGVWFPSHLMVERPLEQGKVDIRWREVRLNEPVTPARFELKLPEGVERIAVK